MKKSISALLLALSLATASENSYIQKVTNFYENVSGNLVKLVPQKSGDGYDIKIVPNSYSLEELFKKDAKIHISVDEGPLITSPSFGFGKAGLESKGNILNLLKDDIAKEIKKDLKDGIKYKYEGKISFSNELKDSLVINPLVANLEDAKFQTSPIVTKSEINLDDFTGKTQISVDKIELKPTKEKGIFKLDKLKAIVEITQKPIDDIFLFGKYKLNIDNIEFKAKLPKGYQEFQAKIDLNSEAKKVDEKLLDSKTEMSLETNNQNTIALLKGIKKIDLELEFKNLGIDGAILLQKISQKLQEAQENMIKATQKNDDVLLQKAILETTEYTNKLTEAINKLIIKDKSKIIVDLELQSLKKSYIKVDLLYKGEPISGDFNSAMISLAAQGLNLFNGDFDIALEGDLIISINPLAPLILDMLKQKGFVTFKDGIYRLKGQLKDGKIIINGKSYTLQELSTVLF